MANNKQAMFGGALIVGALMASGGEAGSAVGDPIEATLTGGVLEETFGDFVGPPLTRQCIGTEFDDRSPGASFRAAFPADCFDDYLVSGEGYGDIPLPGPTGVLTSIEIEVDGTVAQLRLPAELLDSGLSTTSVGDFAIYDSTVSGCNTLFLEILIEPPGDDFNVGFRGLDLTCDEPLYDLRPFYSVVRSRDFTDRGFFGYSVDVGGDNFVIGEPGDPSFAQERGRAWVYEGRGDVPVRLESSDISGDVGDTQFGYSVAISPDGVVAVGERRLGSTDHAVHIFTPNAGGGYDDQRLDACVDLPCSVGAVVDMADDGTMVISGISDGGDSAILSPDGAGAFTSQQITGSSLRSISPDGLYAVGVSSNFFAETRSIDFFARGGAGFVKISSINASAIEDDPLYLFGRHGFVVGNEGTVVVAQTRDTESLFISPKRAGGILHVYERVGLDFSHQEISLPEDLQNTHSFPHSVAINRNGEIMTRAETTSSSVSELVFLYGKAAGAGYELDEIYDPTNSLHGFSKGDVLGLFDDGIMLEGDYLGRNFQGEAYVYLGEAGERGGFLSGPLGTGITPEDGTFIVVDSVPSDPSYPECLANLSYPDQRVPRVCFTSGERENYISALLAVERPSGEVIWIGRFDEEAVAP